MKRFDILVIGAGAAGEHAASSSAGSGRSVGLVERDRFGGTCVFSACIPTKAMVHAARTYKRMQRADFFGLPRLTEAADYGRVKAFKDGIINGIGDGRDAKMEARGITALRGEARFLGPHEIALGDESVQADHIIIAAGTSAGVPPIPGLAEAGCLTNAEALALERVPERLAVIGAGPVGLEFAQLFAAFGSKVRIYEMADRIASLEDEEISAALTRLLQDDGVSVSTGVNIVEAGRGDGGKRIVIEHKDGRRETYEHDEILVAAGRKPELARLNLEAAGVASDRRGITVDAAMRTNVPHIYAAGDITGPPYFTYLAGEQGKTAALNITGDERLEWSYDVLPRATFCDPEIGSVGLTEAQAREQGRKVKTGRFNYADLTRPIVSGETEGFIKVVVDEDSGRIIGGHIIGAEASTLIHELAAAMAAGMTAAELAKAVHSYPTFSEGIRYACQTLK